MAQTAHVLFASRMWHRRLTPAAEGSAAQASPWTSSFLPQKLVDTANTNAGSSNGFNMWLLFPIIIGGLLVFILLVYFLVYCRRRQRNASRKNQEEAIIAAGVDPSLLLSPMSPSRGMDRISTNSTDFAISMRSSSFRAFRDNASANSKSNNTLSDQAVMSTKQADYLYRILQNDPHLAANRLAFDKIAFERQLAKNSFGQVWLCQFEGQEIVVKRLLYSNRDDVYNAMQTFVTEIQVTSSLDHPNIVKFLGVAWTNNRLSSLCLVTEYASNGDLHVFLSKNHTVMLWEQDKLPIVRGVAHAIAYLQYQHEPPVIHRGIRAKTVVLTEFLEPKLIDFSVGRPWNQEEIAAGIGNAYWTAPEILSGQIPSTKSDIFAFGVLLAEVDTGKLPYRDVRNTSDGQRLKPFQILNMVAAGRLRPEFTQNCPSWILRIAMKCLDTDPEQRPSGAELVEMLCEERR